MELKTRTIQTLDHRKSNFQLGGHMIYQNVRFDEKNGFLVSLDKSSMVISLNEKELSRDKAMFEICLSIGTSYRHASIYITTMI